MKALFYARAFSSFICALLISHASVMTAKAEKVVPKAPLALKSQQDQKVQASAQTQQTLAKKKNSPAADVVFNATTQNTRHVGDEDRDDHDQPAHHDDHGNHHEGAQDHCYLERPQPCVPCVSPQVMQSCGRVPAIDARGSLYKRKNEDGCCVTATRELCSEVVRGVCSFDAQNTALKIKLKDCTSSAYVRLSFVGKARLNEGICESYDKSPSCRPTADVAFTADLLVTPRMLNARQVCQRGGAGSVPPTVSFVEVNCPKSGEGERYDDPDRARNRSAQLLTRQGMSCNGDCNVVGTTTISFANLPMGCFDPLKTCPFIKSHHGQSGTHPFSLDVALNPLDDCPSNVIVLGLFPAYDVLLNYNGCDNCTGQNGQCWLMKDKNRFDGCCPAENHCEPSCPNGGNHKDHGDDDTRVSCQTTLEYLFGTLSYEISSADFLCEGLNAVSCVDIRHASTESVCDLLCKLLACGKITDCQFACLQTALKTCGIGDCLDGFVPRADEPLKNSTDLFKTLQSLMLLKSGMLRSAQTEETESVLFTELGDLPTDVLRSIIDAIERESLHDNA